jgi:hypothetical protein
MSLRFHEHSWSYCGKDVYSNSYKNTSVYLQDLMAHMGILRMVACLKPLYSELSLACIDVQEILKCTTTSANSKGLHFELVKMHRCC